MKTKTSLFMAGGLLLTVATANADTITKPHTFAAGTPALADQVNADFDTVYDQVNKVGAAINVDQPTGNVGIGKAPSSSKLDVNGAISASGTLNITTSGTQKAIIATTSGTESAAQFSHTNAASAQAAVSASHSGSGPAVDARNSGTGKAGSYEIMSVTNSQPALYGRTRGTSSAGYFTITNPASVSSTIVATGDGLGNVISASSLGPEGSAGEFSINEPTNTSPAIFADTQGTGYAGWFNKKVLVNGALRVYGAVTGDFFNGDGSGLTNVDAATASAVAWSGITGVPAALADGDDVNDADANPSNELQVLSLVGSNLTLSNGGGTVSINDADSSSTNELQTMSLVGSNLTLSNGGGTVSINDADSSPTNELQTLSLVGSNLTLSNGGGTFSINDADSSPTNELQTLSLVGSNLTLSNGGGTFSINDGDSSATNEYNSAFALSGTVLQLTDGGGLRTVPLAEALAINDLSDARVSADSLFLGSGAGANDDGSSNVNTGVGKSALNANTGGYGNIALGYSALSSNTSGYYNQALGVSALGSNTTGLYNVGVGGYANFSNQAGSNNVMIGYQAGRGTSLHSKSGNIFIGHQAGYWETGSDQLYIENSDTNVPLIHGDFATNALTVNGSLTTTGDSIVSGTASVGSTLDVTGNAAVGPNASVSSSTTLNVQGDASDSVTGYFANIGTAGFDYAVYGNSSGAAGAQHFGIYGNASGGTTYNIGVYGSATGTGAYAGYFVGDAHITQNLHAVGNISYSGTLTDTSDERLKENIKPVENALEKVSAINGVYFNMKDNPDVTEVGVIAQDVQKVLPEAVSIIDKENGYLGVSYPSLIPVLIEALKELKAENEGLKVLVCQDHPEAVICQ